MAVKCPKCHSENPDTLKFCGDCGTLLSPLKGMAAGVTGTLETAPDRLARGTVFAGRYEIIEELGVGGMGRVYRVHDTKLNEEVALKLIRPEVGADERTVERFRNELKTARRIRHKNVCGMYDFHEEGKVLFLTMEYVRGEDLKSLMHRTKALSVGTAVSIAHQISEGLGEAHKLGITHRDLKPGNVMIDKEGNAKIMDFGIARVRQERGMTGEGVIVGTPAYMSPEQVEGKETDPRADIYALGIILFEMLAGRVPFEGETPFAIANKHKSEPPPIPKKLVPQIPEGLNKLILRCLEKDKAKRYQTAEELLADLAAVEEGIPTGERVAPRRRPFTSMEVSVQFKVKRLLVPAAVIIILAAAALVVWKAGPRKPAFFAPKIENSVAVISFENQTGDKSYEYLQKAIPNLLITNLERTGFIKVITWERMEDVLEQFAKDNSGVIDKDAGFEICRREGVGAIVLGSFTKAEETFATDVKVLDVETKTLLRSASSRGEGVSSILKTQIDELSLGIAQGLGIAQEKMEATRPKIEEATTFSMEAYRYFLEGRDAYERWDGGEAIKNLKKAIEIDPDFALAYLKLGEAYQLAGNITLQNDAIKKALTYSDRVSEKERLYIEALAMAKLALTGEKDREEQIRILRQIAEKYPKEKQVYYYMGRYYQAAGDWTAAIEEFEKGISLDPQYASCLVRLGYSYLMKEEYQKAVETFKKYIAVRPGEANPYDSIGDGYYYAGEFDEAILSYKKAEEIEPGFMQGVDARKLSYLYALKEDYGEALRWAAEALKSAQSQNAKGFAYSEKASYYFWFGKFKESFTALDQADELFKAADNEIAMDENRILRIFFYAIKGEFELAKKANDQFLDTGIKYYLRYYSGNPEYIKRIRLDHAQQLGMIEMKEGRTDTARRWLAEAKPLIDKMDEPMRERYLFLFNQTRAEVLIEERQYDHAVSILENSPTSRSPGPGDSLFIIDNLGNGFLNDTLARAYQGKGDLDKAIASYVRLMTIDPKRKERFLIHPLYHYRVGKLYEQKGQKNKAKIEYGKFLNLWKDADPGQPEVEDARTRLAAL